MKKMVLAGMLVGLVAGNQVHGYVVSPSGGSYIDSSRVAFNRVLNQIESDLENKNYSSAKQELTKLHTNQMFSVMFAEDKALQKRYKKMLEKIRNHGNYAHRYFVRYFEPKVREMYRNIYGVAKVIKKSGEDTSRSNLGTGAQEDSYQEWCEKNLYTCLY